MTGDDVFRFYQFSVGTRYDLQDLKEQLNGALAVLVWQFVYDIARTLGIRDAPWIGVAVNSTLVALSAAVTASMARLARMEHEVRAFKITLLSGLCGLYFLSGALFLRDAFLLLAVALLLRSMTHAAQDPKSRAYFSLILNVALSAFFFWYLRASSIGILAVFLIVFSFISFGDVASSPQRASAFLLVIISLIFAASFIDDFLSSSVEEALHVNEAYSTGAEIRARRGSLGSRFIVTQPLPVRIVLGSVYQILVPIPFWGGFTVGSEYQFIKSYQSIYFVGIFPLIICGSIISFHRYRQRTFTGIHEMFVVAFAFSSLACVSATTLDNRHLGQFMPAFIYIASIPRTEKPAVRVLMRNWSRRWYFAILLTYAAWLLLKAT